MSTVKVVFQFVGGQEKSITLERESYYHVATEIMESKDGWFGVKGDLVNLRNVTTCKIIEFDENGYIKEY
jgi:hypothetical protein